ncbi:germination protein YpeB [Bacillus marinisedimentorum]|uniref:germination protein YpeB n=1 Tax=Bacillus marinisedimentorum TaxID=1821260 RepID=UPI000872D49F|nr:germination protein YpeB [Bacillus marinisedimentorum]
MFRTITIIFVTVAAIGIGYWGYEEHQEKNAILIQAENGYQRAFHDLAYQIDLLHDKIGTTLAMNSRQQLSPSLAEVWRITSEAHNDVGQLPLALLPFNKTEEFLSDIGDFSYKTAIRDLEKEPLTDKEYSTLEQLYSQAADIQGELRKVQHMVIENNLRWMDVELALATNEGEMKDNTIIDGFKTVEKNVEGYSEADFSVTSTSMNKKDDKFKDLKGKMVSEQKAEKIAKDYLGIDGDTKAKVTEGGKGADNGFYSVTLKNDRENIDVSMDITKKGGYPIWILQNRTLGEPKISLNKAAEKAGGFLKEHKFENLDLFESAQYDKQGVFTFVSRMDKVRIYPETVKMKVALDTGDVIGFSAEDYLLSHQQREIPEPAIPEKEALAKVNPKVKVMETRQAIILNDLGEEVLVYEIMGTIKNDTYRIFINAENGAEEKVEKLQNAEPLYNL